MPKSPSSPDPIGDAESAGLPLVRSTSAPSATASFFQSLEVFRFFVVSGDSFITARVASAHVLARGLPDRGTGPDYCQRSIFRSAIFLSSVARLMPKIRAA